MKDKILFMTITMIVITLCSVAQEVGTFIDSRDGKTYKTVKIGSQVWMAENLAYKANSNCSAYNNDSSNVTTYGYLYNWETANKVCPSGWHLPTDAEWTTLTTYLGDFAEAGGKLKETGTTHWNTPNLGATNESGFTALPAGDLSTDGNFEFLGGYGYWWSSTLSDQATAMFWCAKFKGKGVVAINGDKRLGYSVRCLSDK
jgi:uncharacterized protein (TIGR02145 family)